MQKHTVAICSGTHDKCSVMYVMQNEGDLSCGAVKSIDGAGLEEWFEIEVSLVGYTGELILFANFNFLTYTIRLIRETVLKDCWVI